MSRGVETLLVEAVSSLEPAREAVRNRALWPQDDFMALNISIANDACGFDSRRAAQSETVQLLADRIAFRHTR